MQHGLGAQPCSSLSHVACAGSTAVHQGALANNMCIEPSTIQACSTN